MAHVSIDDTVLASLPKAMTESKVLAFPISQRVKRAKISQGLNAFFSSLTHKSLVKLANLIQSLVAENGQPLEGLRCRTTWVRRESVQFRSALAAKFHSFSR
jgi:hypothetical protein